MLDGWEKPKSRVLFIDDYLETFRRGSRKVDVDSRQVHVKSDHVSSSDRSRDRSDDCTIG